LPIRIDAGSDLVVSAAIGYAVEKGARVINMSFGGEPASPLAYYGPLIQQSIYDAFNPTIGNAVLCAATMNNSTKDFIPYPAAYPEVLACGASTQGDTRAEFSNYGEDQKSKGMISVAAPGEDIPTTANMGQGDSLNNYTGQWWGTSAATPHVAALAALVISLNQALTSQQVNNIIETTTDKVPNSSCYTVSKPNGLWCPDLGYGRINVLKALQKAINTP
jgi:subtilisin family serine protease